MDRWSGYSNTGLLYGYKEILKSGKGGNLLISIFIEVKIF